MARTMTTRPGEGDWMAPHPYTYRPFPRTMYHRTLAPKNVESQEEQDSLGSGWQRQPFPAEPPQAVAAVAVKEAVPSPGVFETVVEPEAAPKKGRSRK